MSNGSFLEKMRKLIEASDRIRAAMKTYPAAMLLRQDVELMAGLFNSRFKILAVVEAAIALREGAYLDKDNLMILLSHRIDALDAKAEKL